MTRPRASVAGAMVNALKAAGGGSSARRASFRCSEVADDVVHIHDGPVGVEAFDVEYSRVALSPLECQSVRSGPI
jgi:hypothetical protein